MLWPVSASWLHNPIGHFVWREEVEVLELEWVLLRARTEWVSTYGYTDVASVLS